ncbi:unnamed protein product [Ilex paraguariensis]|uniref:BHLH domain-containing protein n=1 Tax=Ilex paraguariensis TaxID=185542 RepID=A0ABC8TTE4_9AQUA
MNRGVLQSSPVQQMVAGSPNWWKISDIRPPYQQSSPFFVPPPTSSSLPLSSSWHDNQELPESWSQLLLGGEEEKCDLSHFQAKKLENWEENSARSYVYNQGSLEIQAAKPTWSHMIPVSSSKSCVTSLSSNMLDFAPNKADVRHPPPDHSSECNSTATGGAPKKARVQPSSTQTSFKVRKEKLGDRITAIHQLVSPFGKTDTASVLLEAIGYIRFLQNQIEALSLPYLGSGSRNMKQKQSVQGERNCLFPEDPGQLVNDNCMKRKAASEQDSHEEPNKDLRSRGLCLVPISCTMQVGSDNGADYWAPALGGGF